MNLTSIIQVVNRYKKAYKNYFSVMLKLYITRKAWLKNNNIDIKVILKDGTEITAPSILVRKFTELAENFADLNTYQNKNISNLSLSKEGISFCYKNHPVVIDSGTSSDLVGVFFKEDYSFLNVAGCDVIDVGVHIGDSPIYFALNGARRVIGLEPYPYAFSYAEKNVKLNKFRNIILLNAGYGKDSKIVVDNNKISSVGSSLIPSNDGKEIQIYSLKTLLNEYEIQNAVLKMDCEGCEYNLLEEYDETLMKFRMMQIEYHYGFEKIKEKLEQSGFKVNYTQPVKFYDADASNPNMVLGFIYAKRE